MDFWGCDQFLTDRYMKLEKQKGLAICDLNNLLCLLYYLQASLSREDLTNTKQEPLCGISVHPILGALSGVPAP